MPYYDKRQIKELLEALKQITSIKLDSQSGTEDNSSICINLAEPIPFPNILHDLSLVESSDAIGDKIKIKLKNSKNGI